MGRAFVPIDRRVALLRGINVGTAKRIAMADLRQLVERLGYQEVRTLLNSGNVVFTVPGKAAADPGPRIERTIRDRLGITTRVTVLTGRELGAAVGRNPLRAVAHDPSRLLVVVLREAGAAASLRPLLKQDWKPEALALGKGVAWLWCPNGSLGGRLWSAVERALGDAGTTRNLATMTKLLALVEG